MKRMDIRIDELNIDDAEIVFDWIMLLLKELGEEGEELGELNRDQVLAGWKDRAEKFHVLVAREIESASVPAGNFQIDVDGGQRRPPHKEGGPIIGILTLSTAFAIYANGEYGVIDEMYVAPQHRSDGVGAKLVEAAVELGKSKGWKRIDVTAPESERWARTRRFYEKLGFIFTGPKLKRIL
jgi:GNAT superfamily N-acetyltransferase